MGAITNPAIPDDQCTLQTCSLAQAHVSYIPTLFGNSLYLGIFGAVLAVQIFLGIRYRVWGFLCGMIGGLTLEILGYYGRVQMHFNPFNDAFLLYLVCLTIGPAFLTASTYLCLARIVVAYGENLSGIQPRTYALLFMSCDFLSLLLQAAGGSMASSANTQFRTDRRQYHDCGPRFPSLLSRPVYRSLSRIRLARKEEPAREESCIHGY
jgi:hypothetical protein